MMEIINIYNSRNYIKVLNIKKYQLNNLNIYNSRNYIKVLNSDRLKQPAKESTIVEIILRY